MSESFKLSVLYGMESMLNTVESTALRRGSMERMGAVCKLIIFYTVHEKFSSRMEEMTIGLGKWVRFIQSGFETLSIEVQKHRS